MAGGAEVRTQHGQPQTYQVVCVPQDELTYEARTADGAVVDGFTVDRSRGTKVVTDR